MRQEVLIHNIRYSWDGFIKLAVKKNVISSSYLTNNKGTQKLERNHKQSRSKISCTSYFSGESLRIPPPPQRGLHPHPRWNRIDVPGLPYAPQDENAVIALFAIMFHRGFLPFQILDLSSGGGIDCVCYDNITGNEVRVEFKLKLHRNKFNHPLEDFDMIVCWENKWHNCPKEVFELSSLLKENNILKNIHT